MTFLPEKSQPRDRVGVLRGQVQWMNPPRHHLMAVELIVTAVPTYLALAVHLFLEHARPALASGCCSLGPWCDFSSWLSAWLPSSPLIKLCSYPLHTGVLTCFRLPSPARFLSLSLDAIECRDPSIEIRRRVGLSYCLWHGWLQRGSSWLARLAAQCPPHPILGQRSSSCVWLHFLSLPILA